MRYLVGSNYNSLDFKYICIFSLGVVAAIAASGWLLMDYCCNVDTVENSPQASIKRSSTPKSQLKVSFQTPRIEGTIESRPHQSAIKSVSKLLQNVDFKADVHLPVNSENQDTDLNHIDAENRKIRELIKPGFAENDWHTDNYRNNRAGRFVSINRLPKTIYSVPSSNELPGNFKIVDSVSGGVITTRTKPGKHYRFSGSRNLRYGADLDESAKRRDFICLSKVIYFESRGEPSHGQKAVAQVVMNRVRSNKFPDTVCGVVFEGEHLRDRCQFSFACDGIPDVVRDEESWNNVKSLAKRIIDGQVWLDEVGPADHYHAVSVNPTWGRSMQRIAKIGGHQFYLGNQKSTAQKK